MNAIKVTSNVSVEQLKDEMQASRIPADIVETTGTYSYVAFKTVCHLSGTPSDCLGHT